MLCDSMQYIATSQLTIHGKADFKFIRVQEAADFLQMSVF